MTQSLIDVAKGRTGNIPPSLLVRHAERVAGASSSNRRAVLDALLELVARAGESRLCIGERPSGARTLGIYRTMLADGAPTGVAVQLRGIDPLVISSDSTQYLQGSLGLCEHSVIVLFDLCSQFGRVRDGLEEQDRAAVSAAGDVPRLTWNPILDAEDPTDWLRAVRVHGIPHDAVAMDDGSDGSPPADATPFGLTTGSLRLFARWFRPASDTDACWRPCERAIDDAHDRLEIVRVLVAISGLRLPLDVTIGRLLDDELVTISRRLRAVIDRDDLVRRLTTPGGAAAGIEPAIVQAVYEHERAFLIHDDRQRDAAFARALAVVHCLAQGAGACRTVLWTAPQRVAGWRRAWEEGVGGSLAETGAATPGGVMPDAGAVLVVSEDPGRDRERVRRFAPDLILVDDPRSFATPFGAFDLASVESRFRLVMTPASTIDHVADLAATMRWIDPRSTEPCWDARLAGGDLLASRLAAHAVYLDGSSMQIPGRSTTEEEGAADAHDALPVGALACSRWEDPAEADHLLSSAGSSRRILGPSSVLYD